GYRRVHHRQRNANTNSVEEQKMKRITNIILSALSLAVLAGLLVQAAGDQVLTFDIAAHCRTFAGRPHPGASFHLYGKGFPGGTIVGISGNDPTQPVNGIKPIGNWIIRGRNSFPFPPSVATAYSSTPIAFGTEYLILDDGRALTYESWQLPSLVVLSSVI